MKTTGRDAELQEAADYYIQQLRSGDFDSAFQGLIDLDHDIVHPLIAAYRGETVSDIRSYLLRIIWEFRTPLALPLLADTLRDRRDTRWRLALDGLVTLASPEAIETLETALRDEAVAPNPDPDYIERVREALQQAQDAHAAKDRLKNY